MWTYTKLKRPRYSIILDNPLKRVIVPIWNARISIKKELRGLTEISVTNTEIVSSLGENYLIKIF